MKSYLYMESAGVVHGHARQFGRDYRRMAVVEWDLELRKEQPKQIRAVKGVRIVEECSAYVGMTERSYGYSQRLRLKALALEMNSFRGRFKQMVRDALSREDEASIRGEDNG